MEKNVCNLRFRNRIKQNTRNDIKLALMVLSLNVDRLRLLLRHLVKVLRVLPLPLQMGLQSRDQYRLLPLHQASFLIFQDLVGSLA